MKKVLLYLFSISAFHSFSQENGNHHGADDHHIVLRPKDSTCLKDCFLKAHWEVHSRTFFMNTINEGDLKDDYALASGAGIGVVTQPIYGFQVGLSGFFIYNLMSSGIDDPDSLTRLSNRYELGLFDIEHPSNGNDLDRLEELFLKYNLSKSSITIGKININTPFVNPQDGRMRPTLEEGVWLNIGESKKFGFNGGWIWEVSPRSTVQWFSMANSMGINPMGVNVDGTRSDYHENIESDGLGIANIYFKPKNNLKVSLWNAYFHNVMNTAMIEINSDRSLSERTKIYQGLMFVHQDAINNGGNEDQKKTYMNKGARSNVISAQVGIKNKRGNTSLNYTHITGDGRYLMPREWGKEPFYTFMPRERNEGMGNVHAFMVKTTLNAFNSKLKTGLAYGYYMLPDVRDHRLNKYGMPSYHQMNFDVGYTFDKFLRGLDVKFLVAYKLKEGETYNNLKYVYNKVNMTNLNLVIDFKI
ncbi:MAG: outer membrane porin, OprD family [Sphingobacteriaceae bacterium]|nr:outer membrane porin, OprD family [Sphingobacteriaceae bacterium]